jgi:hypothetical protein
MMSDVAASCICVRVVSGAGRYVDCSPLGRKRVRHKLTWVEGIRGLMGGKGLMEEDWNDRSTWRKKII